MKNKIRVTRSSMPDFDDYVNEIRDLWSNRWLTNMGEKHNRLETELAKRLGVGNAALFANGHLALEAALEALGCTGEVITTPFTFVSTANAIVRRGLKPVFCDIREDDCTIDTDKIEDLITEKTSAILPVHVYGNICDEKAIGKIAARYGLKVVYDAAHAFGVESPNGSIAGFGDASVYSFHATKVFHTVEGGAVSFRDESLYGKLNEIRDFGITGPESIASFGGNAKMSEFHAAMGLCNLRNIDSEIGKRRKAAERYRGRLSGVRGIKLVEPQKRMKSNYAYFPVVFDGYRKDRDEVFAALSAEGIHPRKYFYPAVNCFDCYRKRFECGHTPVAERISKRILTLPLYAGLEIDDVDRICDIILSGKK